MNIQSRVFEVILNRRSIRKYKRGELSREVIKILLEAARWVPSAKNLQPWHFIVITDRKIIESLVPICNNQEFIKDAAVVIVGLADIEKSPKWAIVDTTIALEHIVLVAHDLGFGTCWIGAFNEDELKKFLKIPDKYKVVALITIGYPDEQPPPRPRKAIDEIASENFFGQKMQF